MAEVLVLLGQSAAALLIMYGGYLVICSQGRKAPRLDRDLEDRLLLLRHLHLDA